MKTEFDVDEKVAVKGEILRIDVRKDGASYLVGIKGLDGYSKIWLKEKDLVKNTNPIMTR